ncbi:serine/threonine-protein kinase [Kitasatospora sp. NPDC101447]|uniref:serine/threonine-protein kinase n=1 Tax=Kitasatospora sp. NPDC101447 TaxID=3364102 RepID=UPI0037F1F189
MLSGTIVAGRYVMDRPMGAGGMGEVWAAQDQLLDRRVAVKLLHRTTGDGRERFLREARAAAGLQHPGIVVVHDFGEFENAPFLVMELLEGRSLEARPDDGPVTVGWVAEVGARVAEALATAHASGLVHRDVKPSNLFLTADGGVKLLDFGLVHERPQPAQDGPQQADHTIAAGTLAYMAPEQYLGRSVDARADLYALGGTLYALLVGHPPVRGRADRVQPAPPPRLRDERPDVPRELDLLIGSLLARDPARRPAGAAAVAEQLWKVAGRHGRRKAPQTVGPVPKQRKQARNAVLFSAGVLVVAVIAMRLVSDPPFGSSDDSAAPVRTPNHPTASARPAQLNPGDCIDYTAPVGPAEVNLNTPVGWQAVDCGRPHQAQVGKVLTMTRPTSASQWNTALAVLGAGCTGVALDAESAHPGQHLARAVLGPSEADWFSGAERFAYCTLHPRDGGPLTVDVRPTAGS